MVFYWGWVGYPAVPDYPAGFFILPDIWPNYPAGFFILPDNPAVYPANPAGSGRHRTSGKKYQIRPNPSYDPNKIDH